MAWDKEKARAYAVKYRLANPEKLKARRAKYQLENPEKVKAYQAKYQLENPEKVKAYQAKYQLENADKLKASAAKYRLANPEKSYSRRLTDNYIRSKLRAGTSATDLPSASIPDSLITLKREHIRLQRTLKDLKKNPQT